MIRDDGLMNCQECREVLPLSEFPYDKNYPRYKFPICVYCLREIRNKKRKASIRLRGYAYHLSC